MAASAASSREDALDAQLREDALDAQLLADKAATGGDAGSTAPGRARWLLALCVLLNLFCNHWARDSLGALEVALESGPLDLSVAQYNALTTGYFVPNIFVPLLAGGIAQRFGPGNALILFASVGALGNGLVALSSVQWSYGLLLGGRGCMGIAYEAVDVLPVGLLSPRFCDCWATLVGVVNSSNRLGSVLNFLVEPRVLAAHGLRFALILPSIIGAAMFFSSLAAHRVDAMLRRRQAKQQYRESRRSEERGRSATPLDVVPCVAQADAAVAGDAPAGALGSARHVLRQLNASFFFYALGLGCAYGAVVPFWFVGSKHLQVHFGMSLADADAAMLLPEGSILVLALPIGLLVDRCKLGARAMLALSAASTCLIGLALLTLAWAPLPPLAGCLLLGASYACTQSLGWAAIAYLTPPEIVNLCSGFVGSAINVVPALLPLVFSGDGSRDLAVLSASAAVGAVCFAGGAACLPRSRPAAVAGEPQPLGAGSGLSGPAAAS